MTKIERERSHIQKQITVSVIIARKIAVRYGLEGSCKKLRGPATRRTDDNPQGNLSAVMAASIISFGFVFLHPFMDGNGRLKTACCFLFQLP
ncbi:Fic family protein [Pseudomonas sp. zjy_15]|uniref:Fic family protein n=1 Tax=unclassified Pseudomonas TaxID=196821 RepID=UPI00370A9383